MFAEVIIPLALPKNYTWKIPASLIDGIQVGCRVEVNLGKNKKYAGIVKRIHSDNPQSFQAKEIINVLDPEPVIQRYQLNLWEWMADYYMCSEGEVMAAALPAHFKLSSETILIYNEEFGDDFSDLDNEEYLVAEALLIKNELKLDRSAANTGCNTCLSRYQSADWKESLFCMGSTKTNLSMPKRKLMSC